MDQKLENKIEFIDRLKVFFNNNKIKIYSFGLIILVLLFVLIFLKSDHKKKNILVAEKYVEAGIYLSSNKSEEAKILYEEVILSGNKFYSILALNTIIEKKLISDKQKILNYFQILEKSISDKSQKDLIILKKALYHFKLLDNKNGNDLLQNLIKKNSILKPLAQELLKR